MTLHAAVPAAIPVAVPGPSVVAGRQLPNHRPSSGFADTKDSPQRLLV